MYYSHWPATLLALPMAKGCAWTGLFKLKWENIGETHGNNNGNYCQLLLALHTCTALNNAHACTLARYTSISSCNCFFSWLISRAISVSKAGPCMQVSRLVSSKCYAYLNVPSLSLIRVSTWAVWASMKGKPLLNLCTWAPESAVYINQNMLTCVHWVWKCCQMAEGYRMS